MKPVVYHDYIHIDNKRLTPIYYKCILCNKDTIGTVLAVKTPEMVWLCDQCSKKHPDHKNYDSTIWEWWAVYVLWKWFVDLN